jgi:glycosyltransferase involved in cell wall biosynthesis
LWVIGKPYNDSDPYARQFAKFAQDHSAFVRFEGPVSDRVRLAEIYREARGFVLLSAVESLSISALEAAACECPLLLGDLPWARTAFGDSASYCPLGSVRVTARRLRQFYDQAHTVPRPPRPAGWLQIARQLTAVYESICASH